MMTVDAVLSEFGGAQAVADLLRVTYQAVHNMKMRGTVPSRHWAKLVAEAKALDKQDITFENLAAIKAPRRKKRAA